MADLDRKKIAADWASRGFSCDLWTDAPDQRWEDFRDFLCYSRACADSLRHRSSSNDEQQLAFF